MAEDQLLQIVIKARDLASAEVKKLEGSLGGLRSSFASVGRIAAGVTGAITAIGGAALALAKETAAVGGQLDNLSQRTGVSMEALSAFRVAATWRPSASG